MKDDIGINTILRYREHIWLGSHNGLIRFNPESKEFKTYLANPTYIDFYSSNVFRGLYVDQQDMLWAGMGFSWVPDKTKGGLYKYQPEKDNFIEYHHDPSIGCANEAKKFPNFLQEKSSCSGLVYT